jgi:integrase
LHPSAKTWLAWWLSSGWKSFVGRAPTAEDFVFPSASGEPIRTPGAAILRNDLKKAGLPQHFTTVDGKRIPFTFHATKRTAATWLADTGADGELIDRVLGHSAKTVRGKFYEARLLGRLAEAINRIELTLPTRAGVVQSSPESSQPRAAMRKEEEDRDVATDMRR